MVRWIFFLLFVLFVELYAYQAFRTVVRVKWVHVFYLAVSIAAIGYIVYSFTQFDRSVGQNRQTLFTFGLLLLMYIPKIILTVVLFSEDFFRVISGVVSHFSGRKASEVFLPERRKFVSQVALGLAAIPFLSLIYGMTKGKYNFKVVRKTLYFKDLPDAFDGFTLTQISDIHSGSFDSKEKIEYAVDLINDQRSDMVVFTGDIVNTHAVEMDPWIETFKKIDTPAFGKYSILGNHDYGEYIHWTSQQEKEANFKAIKDIHGKIGFHLLMNESVILEKEGEVVHLIGVENWGANFKKAGDLGKATEGIKTEEFKILLSHDPSHWELEVREHPKKIQLTLSGHTHGLQFGIEIPEVFKWSPVQYVYKYWAGLYEEMDRFLYVNRGFGFHAYPGRVGIWPEITVLELKKAQKTL